jgi:pyroglutamyl-peptidase
MIQTALHRILVTGFEPFGGSKHNPSEQVAKALDGEKIGGAEICTVILPVDTARAPQMLLDLLDDHCPDAVICLGEAAGRSAISVERIATNLLDFRIPDNAGMQIVDQPVIEGGPDAYFATLPVRKIVEAIRAEGVPAELSMSAGTYLCNQVLYTMLHHLRQNGRIVPAGFIHMPSLPEQVVETGQQRPSMERDTALRGITAALTVLAETAG